MLTKNGPFKDHLTLNVGEDLRICYFNIERISKLKGEVLTNIMNKERIDVIALEETHTKDDNDSTIPIKTNEPQSRSYGYRTA